ncbi:ArnT family glycosyltransferase [Candidatus Nitrospira salsa]
MKQFSQSGWGHWCILGTMGLLAFFYNISSSLFGVTEGLYASVTETMVRTGEYVHLSLHGQPYLNKPPMFFWLQAVSTKFLGWHETALRLPSALFSFGTVVITYWLGRTLFSATAGFWAAFVTLTCYVSLWFGGMAIIDPVLTFCMTLGVLGLVRAYFQEGTIWWYSIGFVALAFGTMVKNFHALTLPVLLFFTILLIRRDSAPLKTPSFGAGVLSAVGLLGLYYAYLGGEFFQHYILKENLLRMTRIAGDTQGSILDGYFGKRPIVWYGIVIWFDFFPWSVLLPSGLLLLWKQRSLTDSPREMFLLIWVVGYFLAFSLFPEKHERYLMPMVPGIAVLVGYFYYRVLEREDFNVWETSVFQRMLGLLSFLCLVLIIVAPYLLNKKWNVPFDVFPLMYQVPMFVGAGLLLYAVIKAREMLALKMVGMLAVGLMIGIVVFIVPGIHAVASSKHMMIEVQSFLKNPDDPIRTFQHWNWRSDEDLYYWLHVHKHQGMVGEGLNDEEALAAVRQEIERSGELVILMTEPQYQEIINPAPGLTSRILREFLRPKTKIVLVSIT